jgi:hypothetical protein
MKKILLLTVLTLTLIGIAPAKQKLILLAPNGGESMTAGSPQMISWSYSGLSGNETMLIALEGPADSGPITYCQVSLGSFPWPAGKKMDGTFAKPANDYMVIIELVENDGISDMSDATFAITGIVPNISLMAPNGGEALNKGMETDINWAFAGKTGFVSLTLLKDDQPLGLIADNLPAMNFRYRWHVGVPLLNGMTYPGGGNYRIQIQWRPRPSTEKFDPEARKARGAGFPDVQTNVDRSDGAFSIQETVPGPPQKAKTEKE